MMRKAHRTHRGLALTTLLVSLAAATSPVVASPYSSTVFFGDSLTDAGYFEGLLGQQASMTTNPDRVWAFHLATALGTTAAQATRVGGVQIEGGTNHAVSGARILSQNGFPNPFIAQLVTPVKTQVSQYLAQHPRLDSNGLYSVWAGANDVLAFAAEASDALKNPATQAVAARSVVENSAAQATAVVGMVHALHDAGAKTVLLLNLPDIGNTPLAQATGSQALLSAASQNFNTALVARMGKLKGDLVMLNVQDMLDEVIKTPEVFGLRNVTSPACNSVGFSGSVESGRCTPETLVEPDAASQYLFADTIHPTGAGHKLLADYALSVLRAPKQMSLLAEAPLAGTAIVQRTIETRLRDPRLPAGTHAYAVYTHSKDRLDARSTWQPGYRNGINALTIGVDHNVQDRLLIGAALTHAQHGASLGQDAGKFDLGQTLVSVYGQYRVGGWRAGLDASAGTLAFDRIERNVRMGEARLREKSDTEGTQALLRASTAYDLNLGVFTFSPTASLTAQRVTVSGFSESRTGGKGTSMQFENQTRHSLVSSIGLGARADITVGQRTLQPYADIAWEREHRNPDRSVRGNVRGMAGSFGHLAYKPAKNTTVAAAGINAIWSKTVQTQVGYVGRFADNARSHSVQAGLKYVF